MIQILPYRLLNFCLCQITPFSPCSALYLFLFCHPQCCYWFCSFWILDFLPGWFWSQWCFCPLILQWNILHLFPMCQSPHTVTVLLTVPHGDWAQGPERSRTTRLEPLRSLLIFYVWKPQSSVKTLESSVEAETEWNNSENVNKWQYFKEPIRGGLGADVTQLNDIIFWIPITLICCYRNLRSLEQHVTIVTTGLPSASLLSSEGAVTIATTVL